MDILIGILVGFALFFIFYAFKEGYIKISINFKSGNVAGKEKEMSKEDEKEKKMIEKQLNDFYGYDGRTKAERGERVL